MDHKILDKTENLVQVPYFSDEQIYAKIKSDTSDVLRQGAGVRTLVFGVLASVPVWVLGLK